MRKYLILLSLSLILGSSKTSEFKIEGMMCNFGCVKKIEKELNSIKGISDLNISFEKSNIIVTYDQDLVNDKMIIKRLNTNTNYLCSLKEDKEENSFISFFKNLF